MNTMLARLMKGTQLVITFNRSVFSMQHSVHISSSSIITDGNFCSDISKFFNYKFRGRRNDDDNFIILITRCFHYIQRYKRSEPVHPSNMTVTTTFPAVFITVSADPQTLPTSEEFVGRADHNPIMQYPDKGHRSRTVTEAGSVQFISI